MKSKITQKKIKEFQPITVEITIESMGELKDLLMRMDLSQHSLKKVSYSYNDDNIKASDMTQDLWKELDTLYTKLKDNWEYIKNLKRHLG